MIADCNPDIILENNRDLQSNTFDHNYQLDRLFVCVGKKHWVAVHMFQISNSRSDERLVQ